MIGQDATLYRISPVIVIGRMLPFVAADIKCLTIGANIEHRSLGVLAPAAHVWTGESLTGFARRSIDRAVPFRQNVTTGKSTVLEKWPHHVGLLGVQTAGSIAGLRRIASASLSAPRDELRVP